MAPRGAEATVPAGRPGQRADLMKLHPFHPLDHELRDPVPAPEADRLRLVGIEQRDLDLAAVASVDGSRRVHDRDPMARGQPRAGMHERRITGWQRDSHSGRDQGALPRCQVHVLRREEIRTGIAGMSEDG
jgi:hypothetical protein